MDESISCNIVLTFPISSEIIAANFLKSIFAALDLVPSLLRIMLTFLSRLDLSYFRSIELAGGQLLLVSFKERACL